MSSPPPPHNNDARSEAQSAHADESEPEQEEASVDDEQDDKGPDIPRAVIRAIARAALENHAATRSRPALRLSREALRIVHAAAEAHLVELFADAGALMRDLQRQHTLRVPAFRHAAARRRGPPL